MAGHGVRQLETLAKKVMADKRRAPLLRLRAEYAFDFIEWSKAHRTPNRPRGKVYARRITAQDVLTVHEVFADDPGYNQQALATELGLGTGGRITEILNGDWDHLLEG